jgi:acyl carrier protein
VAEVFGLPLAEVSRGTSSETVEEWDSLNVLNILMAVESEFGVSISPEEAAGFVSVEKIMAVLESKGVA